MGEAPSHKQIDEAIRTLAMCQDVRPDPREVVIERDLTAKLQKEVPEDHIVFVTPCKRFFLARSADCDCSRPAHGIYSAMQMGFAILVLPPERLNDDLVGLTSEQGYVTCRLKDFIPAHLEHLELIQRICDFPDPVMGGVQ